LFIKILGGGVTIAISKIRLIEIKITKKHITVSKILYFETRIHLKSDGFTKKLN